MTEHAGEFIPYLLTMLGFFAVYVLRGIKDELKDLKLTVKGLENDLRGGYASLDRRMTKLETRCDMNHDHTQD